MHRRVRLALLITPPVLASAAAAAWYLTPTPPVGPRQAHVYTLDCGAGEDGRDIVLGRSYSRGAMEALLRKTLVDGKVANPSACEIKTTVALVPSGEGSRTSGRPVLSQGTEAGPASAPAPKVR